MITFKQKGDFSKFTNYLEKIKHYLRISELDRFGRKGVELLSMSTPMDTGKTSRSWVYEIDIQEDYATISFHNTNIVKGVPIAIVLQYGHGTRNGGYVQGRDYINPVVQPLFDEIAQKAWEEVTRT